MTPEQANDIVELYEATHGEGRDGLRNVYVIGSLTKDELVAVAIQQTRAINLVRALLRTPGRLDRGMRIAVLGAGAAGLTAAAYAMSQGVRVTTFENRQPLWNLRGCRTRWLHPSLFPRWPEAGWDVSGTQLPVMNWFADYACNVGELLWSKYKSFQAACRTGSELVTMQRVTFHPVADQRWQATIVHHPSTSGDRGNPRVTEDGPFDAVLVAVGFGAEAPRRDAAASVYWLEDALEREDPHRSSMRYLVSGTGDGGLTDLLRIRLQDFRHHHLRDILQKLPTEALQDQLLDAERKCKTDRELSDAYLAIAKRMPFGPINGALRPNTSVVLTNRIDIPFPRGKAWRISQFLAAMLIAHEADTRYIPGGGIIIPIEQPGDRTPERFLVYFKEQLVEVDAIVVRHGTTPAIDRVLRDFGLSPEQLVEVRNKWAGQITSKPIGWDRENLDHRRRARTCKVRPVTGARTPIGLLSRLVTLVGSLRGVGRQGTSPVRSDLVVEELALTVTAESERRPEAFGPGWALRGELNRDHLLDAIARIDLSLDCLAKESLCKDERRVGCPKCQGQSLADRRRELELHWVLPRHEWLRQPSRLLNHVVAATWWGDLRLRHLDLRGVVVPATWSDDLHRMLRADHTLYVVDIDEGESSRRLAIVPGRDAETIRLAAELAAETVLDPEGWQAI